MTRVPSYAAAGVDVEAGERAVALMRSSIARAQRVESVGNFGGFAGLFDASALRGYTRPLLATSTDGVGTKVAVAKAMQRYDTIGIDLVAMIVDDLVVCGAEPLFLTDYIATGAVKPERIAAIVSGIARGCVIAGCALLGGETAEHPGLMEPDDVDIAGAGTGVVEADDLLGAHRVRAGDVVIAMNASGLHSNGYSFVRATLLAPGGVGLDHQSPDLGGSVGEALLTPTRIYSQDCLALARAGLVHAFSHVTGGGIAANLARVLPVDCAVEIDRSRWELPAVFALVARESGADLAELERTFNMGVGMLAVGPAEDVDAMLRMLDERGLPAWVCGEVRERRMTDTPDSPAKGGEGGAVMLRGRYGRRSSSSADSSSS